MYPNPALCQLLRSCMEEVRPAESSAYLEFPLEEFLYTVLADQIELRISHCSLAHLPELVEEYCSQYPGYTLTAKNLLSEGWLSPFLDRWDFGVSPSHENLKEETLRPEQREYAAFLRWLKERQENWYEIFVPQFEKNLSQFQAIFPQMPDRNWFIQEGFLSSDGAYLTHGRQGSRSVEAGALARLWSRHPGSPETDWADWWLDLAMALGAMHGAFEKLPYEQQQFLLKRIIARLEAGQYPDIPTENRRILLSEALHRAPDEIDTNWHPLSGDLILDLQTFDLHSHDWDRTLIQRKRIIHSYLRVLCDYLDRLDNKFFSRAADIISSLAKIGCLNELSLPPESIFRLWQSSNTSLLACEHMLFHSARKPKLQDNLFTDTFRQMIEKILLDPHRPVADGIELSRLLLFFALHFKTGRTGELGNKALGQLLTVLKRRRRKLEPQLEQIVHELKLRIEAADDRQNWSKVFRLACLLMQELYDYRDTLSTNQEAPSRKALRELLFAQYVRFFRPDVEFLKHAPSLLDMDCFSHIFWNEIYQERREGLHGLGSFLRPEILPPDTSNSQIDNSYRYKGEIHLAVLTVLMQNRKKSDTILEETFSKFLSMVFHPKHKLLGYDFVAATNALPAVEAALGLVREDQECFADFLQKMKQFDLPELILICHAAQDDGLKERCIYLIQQRFKAEKQLPHLYAEASLIQMILESRIECLYPAAERMLERQMDRWNKYPGPAFQREERQTAGQLNRVWMQQNEYDMILKHGDPFYRAIVYMESTEHRDLQQAESIWKHLLEKQFQPAFAINLVYTYSLQYEQEKQRGIEGEDRLCQVLARLEELRERMESGPYATWEEEEKKQYAANLYAFYCQSSKDKDKLAQSLCTELDVNETLFAKLDEQETEGGQFESVEIPSKNPVPALQTYCTALLNQKAEWFFQMKSCGPAANPKNALLVWCVMKTCAHLMAYGPQLIFHNGLDEDRCTQLFRELFNQACPEMFTLEVNDQEQTGQTSSQRKHGQKGIAEVDLTFKTQGFIVSIGEALRLLYMNKIQIRRHINKLLGNNNLHVPMFLLIYGKTDDPDALWRKYSAYVQDEFTRTFKDKHWGPSWAVKFTESEDYVPGLHDLFYFHRRMLCMSFGDRESDLPPMYHIFLSIGNQENTSAAAAAREKC